MQVQKELIESYLKKTSYPGLKEIAAQTGLNISRVFRILNGAKLKLDEYLIFKNLVDDKISDKSEEEFVALLKRLTQKEAKDEIFNFIERSIRKENLKTSQNVSLQELGA